MIRAAIFTDNDFAKVNGVTTTLKAVLRYAPADISPRIYTASDVPAELADYFAVAALGLGLPWYREMRVYWPRLRAFEREIRHDGCDVIHVTTPGPIGLAGRLLAARLTTPTTGSFHTNLGDYVATFSGSRRLGQVVDRYMRWLYGPCDPVLVPSEATRDDLARLGYRRERLKLWTRGVDADQFHPARRSESLRHAWGVDERRPAILYVGRVSREKGLDLLPAIQRQLAAWSIGHRLVIVGDGPMAGELRTTCPDAVFLGTRPHDEVAIAMASADVFLFPSGTDTLGNVVLEAQACGLPVVVSDRGGPQQHMFPGRTGWIAPNGNASSFADRVAAIVRNPEDRRAMSLEARAFALTHTWAHALVPLTQAWRAAARRRAAVPRESWSYNDALL